jgi:transposase-like protein
VEEKSLKILRSIAAGVAYRKIAEDVGESFWKVYEIAKRVETKPRCRRLSAQQRLAIVRDLSTTNQSFGRIAAKHGTSKGQVHRIAVDLRERAAKDSGEVKFATNTRTVHHCPTHGKVSVWPCVACAANAARRGATERQTETSRKPGEAFAHGYTF